MESSTLGGVDRTYFLTPDEGNVHYLEALEEGLSAS